MTDLNVSRSLLDSSDAPLRFCFVCGAHMNETWRTSGQGGAYVWYQCSRPRCDQTYLIREIAQHRPVFNEMELPA